ncbi:MAG TPA: nuclear transport factor 2 family protein [Aliidongia sp.]|nr:nuclear transport factor 2 family protein [Aliidongia sp.]
MSDDDFAGLLRRLTAAADDGDGAAFAACFTPDAIYHDYIYGDHQGRDEIAHMLTGLFHRDAGDYRWEMFDPVSDGRIGYAWSLSSFTSKLPEFAGKRVVIDGMSRFVLEGGLIADYRESVNGGVAMVQLGIAAGRIERVLQRWSGALQAAPETIEYLARSRRP